MNKSQAHDEDDSKEELDIQDEEVSAEESAWPLLIG